MHYSYSDPRVNKTKGLADARKEAASIREQIKKRDAEVAHKEASDPYSFEVRKQAYEWKFHKRNSLVSRLNLLEREIGWQSPDAGHKPATGSFFHGSDR